MRALFRVGGGDGDAPASQLHHEEDIPGTYVRHACECECVQTGQDMCNACAHP